MKKSPIIAVPLLVGVEIMVAPMLPPIALAADQVHDDFKVSAIAIDVELGAGYGFTPGSDRFVLKAILGYAFPVPGKGNDGGRQTPSMRMGSSAHATDDLMMSSLGYPLVMK